MRKEKNAKTKFLRNERQSVKLLLVISKKKEKTEYC